MKSPRFTGAVGQKFNIDGTPQHFPGNTIICFIDPDSASFAELVRAQQHLARTQGAEKFTFLPPSSLHMTVMELLCDRVRTEDHWSRFLPLDASLQETDRYFKAALQQFPAPSNFQMAFSGINSLSGLTIDLEPFDPASRDALWRYREQIADATGVRFPDHETYQFHITLAYKLLELEPYEQQELEAEFNILGESLRQHLMPLNTGRPQLTFFNDMHRFVPHDRSALDEPGPPDSC